MGSEKNLFRTLISVQMVFLCIGCGEPNRAASIAMQFPGAVPSVLPGAEIISQEAFNNYLQSGRLAPFKLNVVPAAGKEGSGTSTDSGAEFQAAASLGDDILLVDDYLSSHPGSPRPKAALAVPETTIEVLDSLGNVRKFQSSDNSYRIVSVAHAIRRQRAREGFQASSLQSFFKKKSIKNGPSVQLAKISPQLLKKLSLRKSRGTHKRALASDDEGSALQSTALGPSPTPSPSPFPAIRCSTAEVGHGSSLDEGGTTGGIKQAYRVFSDGLISNFDWPLKNSVSCIKDQGIRGSCTAFAVIGAMEILISQKYNVSTNLSEQALYFRGKGFLDDYSPGSDGFSAQLYLEDFEKNASYRVNYEKGWDYNISSGRKSDSDFTNSCSPDYKEFCSDSPGQGRLYCTRPTTGIIQCGYLTQIESLALGAKVVSFDSFLDLASPSASLNKAIEYLKQGVPVVVETTLTKMFYTPSHGYVAEPTANDSTVGGHSTLVVGHISEAELVATLPARQVKGNGGFFIIKNSWGPAMGDAGYFYVSFNYLVKYAYSLFAIQDANLAQ
jgi:C1A family cysteine protease